MESINEALRTSRFILGFELGEYKDKNVGTVGRIFFEALLRRVDKPS